MFRRLSCASHHSFGCASRLAQRGRIRGVGYGSRLLSCADVFPGGRRRESDSEPAIAHISRRVAILSAARYRFVARTGSELYTLAPGMVAIACSQVLSHVTLALVDTG
jgi:hypothetical protein